MKRCVVLTTINACTEAVIRLHDVLRDAQFDIIIVGDRKTPNCAFYREKCIFLDVQAQTQHFPNVEFPYNHYCRKNLGYLYAVKNNYQIIYETDDDNIPYDEIVRFLECSHASPVRRLRVEAEAEAKYANASRVHTLNVYRMFTNQFIWPRGLPLHQITKEVKTSVTDSVASNVAVIQSLVNNDPDVDAIYRLTHKSNENFVFDVTGALVEMPRHLYAPFNTQATLWIDPAVFYLLYVPCTTDFRYCDILRGYVAQRCLWENDKTLAFADAFVYQKRNEHDYMLDFRDEMRMYTTVDALLEMLSSIELCGDRTDLKRIYGKCVELGIVKPQEMAFLDQWLSFFH